MSFEGAESVFTRSVILEPPESSGVRRVHDSNEHRPSTTPDFTAISATNLQPYIDLAAPLSEEKTGNNQQVPLQNNSNSFCIRRPQRQDNRQTHGDNDTTEKHSSQLQTILPFFSYERCRLWGDLEFKHLTGIDLSSFEVLYTLLGGDEICSHLKYNYDQVTPKRLTESIHSTKGYLFLTLVRLHRGFVLWDMRYFFNLDESFISRIFRAWIKLMSIKFRSMEEAIFVSASAQNKNTPDCYRPFPNLRCVIDAFEIFIQKLEDMEQQSNTFSSYKHTNTAKFLVGSSVYGGVSFISDGMEGNASDRKLFMKSGILQHLKSGEAVMADRGFDVEPELNKIGVDLIIPPFLGNRQAFTERELMRQRSIAAARSHVETVIGRIKNFNLLHGYPNTMLDILSDVVRVAANLVNFGDPFIRWDQKKKMWKKKLNVQ